MDDISIARALAMPRRTPIIRELLLSSNTTIMEAKLCVDEAYAELNEQQKRTMPLEDQEAYIARRAKRILAHRMLS